jgi:hypothetical protein
MNQRPGESEATWQYASHTPAQAVEQDRFADNGPIGTEAARPEIVAE